MWSVWPETVDVYLGQTLAMIRVGRGAGLVQQHSATLPMQQVLTRLSVEATSKQIFGEGRRRRLRIMLSGALCPAIGFTAPREVCQWDELRSIASAAAAQSSGADPEQWLCAIDAKSPGVAAMISRRLVDDLTAWAANHDARIASLRPAWSIASHCPAVRRAGPRAILLHEPDGITVLAEDATGPITVESLGGTYASDIVPVQLRRWIIGRSLAESQVFKLGFTPEPISVMARGPKVWPDFWRIL